MKLFTSTILIGILLLAASCSSTKKDTVPNSVTQFDNQFQQHITGFTGGLISRSENITINLSQAASEETMNNSSLGKELFDFEPEIKGKVVWKNKYTVEFQPEEELPSSEMYKAKFHLDKIINVEDRFKEFEFYFKTKDLIYQVFFYPYQNIEGDMVNVTGRLIFTDIVDSSLVRKMLTAQYNGGEKALKIKMNSPSNYTFMALNIKRLDKEAEFVITHTGEPIGLTTNGKKEQTIPSKNSFELLKANFKSGSSPHLQIVFSDDLDPYQELEGMISVKNQNDDNSESDFESIIEGNKIKLFFDNMPKGDRLLKIENGIKNSKGIRLTKSSAIEIYFEDAKPMLEVLGEGTIVPTTDGAHFPFKAINLRAVDVFVTKINSENMIQFFQENNLNGSSSIKRVGKEIWRETMTFDDKQHNLKKWNNFAVNISKFVEEDPQAMYHVSLKYKKTYSLYDCENINESASIQKMSQKESVEWSESDWNAYSWYSGDYYDDQYDEIREWDNPCGYRYYRNKQSAKNVIVSDIGVIAKAGSDNTLHIFASNLKSTDPIADAKIEYFSYTQKKLGESTTDAQGMSAKKFTEKPFVVCVSNNGQKTFLRLRDADSKSVSKFEVEGQTVKKGVKGYIYAERGVWRPGDSIYLNFMLEDKSNVIPATHPITFTLTNPTGVVVDKQVSNFGLNGLYDFRTSTFQNAKTGNYVAKVKFGNHSYTKIIKVETVKPNRLKINLSSENEILKKSADNKLTLHSQWLHGAKASGLKAKVEMRLSTMNTKFKGYRGYIFDDPHKYVSSSDKVVFEGNLNSEGNVDFNPELYSSNIAPGMLNAVFSTKVFESGGTFSIDRKTFTYSPFESYVGLRAPEGSMFGDALVTGEDHEIEIATVDEDGNPTNDEVEIKFYKIDHNWWWDSYNRNISSYINRSSTVAMDSKTMKLNNGKGIYKIRVDEPEWGRYYVKIKNTTSGHTTGKMIYIDWPYWSRKNRKSEENAAMLGFSVDKDKYQVGESVKLTIPSPKKGRALVSVENGTKILKKFWVETKSPETKLEIATTDEMAPNAYVHITLVQPHAATSNDQPIRMYGVVPLMVENPKTIIEPTIEMPSKLSPESTVSVRVGEKSKRKMTYTLAIVDEGLLDLTRFQTPDPWNNFYAKEALGVRTWDVYDDVLGAYGSRIDQLLAVGGDGAINRKPSAKANRFKPMVCFVGPFEYDGVSTNNHRIDIPNYVGSVKVMVVALGENESYGNAEKIVPVKSPVMVLASLPRVVGPEEIVTLPVTVFAAEEGVENVQVTVSSNDKMEVVGPTTKAVKFSGIEDKTINFKLKVKDKLGIGEVKIVATDGSNTARYEVELDVRPPNPPVTWTETKVLDADQAWDYDLKLNGIEGTNNVSVEVSSIPSINLGKRLKYLTSYPHGCIEQTTSGAFPQLYIGKITEVDSKTKTRMENNVSAAIERISMFQLSDGSFSYWPGNSYTSDWGTTYAGHFLLEAEKNGFNIPYRLKRNWKRYQRKKAREWYPKSNYQGKVYGLDQAYRLYTLALAGDEELGAMNRLKEANISTAAKWRLAAAYALIGRKEVARSLIQNADQSVAAYREFSYTYGSQYRDEAMILETMTLLEMKVEGMNKTIKLAERLSSNRWMSTQTTAFCLKAIGDFMSKQEGEFMEFEYQFDKASKYTTKTAKTNKVFTLKEKNQGISVKNNGKKMLFVKVIHTGVPLHDTEESHHRVLSMSFDFYNTSTGAKIDPLKIKQGTDFTMDVTIKNNGLEGNVDEIALTEIFPSGWEIHNARMNNYSSSSSYIEYQDIRDDRVSSYFDLRANKSIKVSIKLNASYLGKFYMPGILCEAMYDGNINAFQKGAWVEVVE